MNKKYLKPALAIALVAAMAVGGSLAYITDKTGPIDNKFIFAGSETNTPDPAVLDIDLTEVFTKQGINDVNPVDLTKLETDPYLAKVLPGDTLKKHPVVSIEKLDKTILKSGAYIFVEITDDNDLMNEFGFAVNKEDWALVDGTTNVYSMEYTEDVATHTKLPDVFSDPEGVVTDSFVATAAQAISVQAFAIQKSGFTLAEDAWEALAD